MITAWRSSVRTRGTPQPARSRRPLGRARRDANEKSPRFRADRYVLVAQRADTIGRVLSDCDARRAVHHGIAESGRSSPVRSAIRNRKPLAWDYDVAMAYRFFSVPAVALAIAAFAGVRSTGQAPSPSAKPASKSTWTPTRTPDGQPDLQGYWTNATFTPLERPAEFAGKEFFTPEEAAAFEKRRVDAFLGQPADNIHYDDAIWQTETYKKGVSGLRTSLIVDPRDGRIPPLTPEARKRAADRAARRGNPDDAAENRTNLERCFTWGADVPPLLPAVYYSNLQIIQGAGYVVVMTETIHSARIIPLDGRPHLGRNLGQWIGDSRGHWEGNTLVVDTTNYSDKIGFRGAAENLHTTERFTRVDADTIRYEFTVDDPTTWTRSWSAEIPMKRMQGPLYEYACTEGNYGLMNILRGARAEDAKAEAAAKANPN